MVPARQQKAAIQARAAAHAGGLGKAGNDECGLLLPCPKGCPEKAASAALQILAGPPARLRFAPCVHCLYGATGSMKRLRTGSRRE
ncbi:exodeoxyribonuclease V, beta subunit [Alicycliphilus sp. B1]|nr:exodeoxyribonuclease V, beta subunit [Alicycliphilus sp. B1]